jgi:predicted transposase/invertase (TIGR01784 family)
LPPELDTAHVNKAIDILDVMNLCDEEREAYEGREKFYWIEANALVHQHALGVEKGREEGEAIATRKMVMAMLQKGIDDVTIIACAGITVEALNDIRSSLI